MVEEESDKKFHPKEDEDEEEDEEDDSKKDTFEAKKSFRKAIKSNFEVMTDVIQSLAETQKSVSLALGDIGERLKALEKPTDLPLKPSNGSGDDIGAAVKVPDVYQSNSIQASLDDDGEGHGKDKGKLSMQEKTYTTSTPRPSAPIDTVNKSLSKDYNPVLKDARESGDLSSVARNILSGKYYTPSEQEGWF